MAFSLQAFSLRTQKTKNRFFLKRQSTKKLTERNFLDKIINFLKASTQKTIQSEET